MVRRRREEDGEKEGIMSEAWRWIKSWAARRVDRPCASDSKSSTEAWQTREQVPGSMLCGTRWALTECSRAVMTFDLFWASFERRVRTEARRADTTALVSSANRDGGCSVILCLSMRINLATDR